MTIDQCIAVGKVSRLHGYKGEVSLKLDHGLPFDFEEIETYFLEIAGKLVPYFVEGMRFTPKGFALTYFEGVDTEAAAKRLLGASLYLPRDQMAELADDEVLLAELVGFDVTDAQLGPIGKIVEVIEHPGNILLSIEAVWGLVLVPYIDEFVVEMDKEQRLLAIDTPEGLLHINSDED